MTGKFGAPMAALLTPRTAEGAIDSEAIQKNIDFVLSQGVKGVVVCGATGEYVALSQEARKFFLEKAAEAARGRGHVLCSVGAADLADCVTLARHALSAGADAVLLPTPHFYPYPHEDLEAFYRQAAQAIDGPILLYNLPSFTSPIEADLAVRLIESVSNIVGIKDSSGKLDTLQTLTERLDLGAHRILGHDRALVDGLQAGCIDNVISGVAGVIPELIVSLFEAHHSGATEFPALERLLHEFLDKLEEFPFPVSLKLTAQIRGLFEARFSLPLSERRKQQAKEYGPWFENFWARCEKTIEMVTKAGGN